MATAQHRPKVAASARLQAQLKLQDEVAQASKAARSTGALNSRPRTRPVIGDGKVVEVIGAKKNRATGAD